MNDAAVIQNESAPDGLQAINLLLFLTLPVLLTAYPFVWYGITGERASLNGELGSIELLTVGFLLTAIIINVVSFLRFSLLTPAVRVWLGMLVLGSIYFAGEEASWGQHIFGWATSESWAEINNQHETNLHNVHGLFDQVPRFLISLGIFIGGIVLPIIRGVKGISMQPGSVWFWILPTVVCLPAACIATLARPVFSILDIVFISAGEFKEYLIALFILVYSLSLLLRLRSTASPAVAEVAGGQAAA